MALTHTSPPGSYAGQLDPGSTDTPDFFDDNDESGIQAAAAKAQATTTKKEANDALSVALQSDSWTIGGIERSEGELAETSLKPSL